MGFWNALSVLAPIAPAQAQAQELLRNRGIENQKASDQSALSEAQTARAKMPIQIDDQPTWDGQQWSQRFLDPDKGIVVQKVDRLTPAQSRQQQIASINQYKTAMKQMMPNAPDEYLDYMAAKASGIDIAGPRSTLKNIPGQAGQPYLSDDGKTYVRTMLNDYGQTVLQPMPPDWKPAPEKLGSQVMGTANGKNVFAFKNMTKGTWQDIAGNPLPDFKPNPVYAQLGSYQIANTVDPNTGMIAPATFNARTGQVTPAPSGSPTAIPANTMTELNKEMQSARDSQTRLTVMNANAQRAYQGDQQAQLSLLANHIGMTSGIQKGMRINQAQWNEALASAPWMSRLGASWFHQDTNGDYIFDGLKSGVNLTGEQIKQMIDLAKERADAQWAQAQSAGASYGVDLSGTIAKARGASARPATTVTLRAKKPDGSVGVFNVPVNEVSDFKRDHPDAYR